MIVDLGRVKVRLDQISRNVVDHDVEHEFPCLHWELGTAACCADFGIWLGWMMY
jgi:hypothetical protein